MSATGGQGHREQQGGAENMRRGTSRLTAGDVRAIRSSAETCKVLGRSVAQTNRPRLLDLFSGAGGAAMGYHRAGFDVVGVDIYPQPNYPFEVVQMDALEAVGEWTAVEFDAIHASPPCQAYSRATAWRGDRASHQNLIAPVRDLLIATELPYVIENVQEARGLLRNPVMLCGTSLGLPVRRHRYFELSWNGFWMAHPCRHRSTDYSHDHGAKQTESVYRDAMGCEWMTVVESREAIPPAYTEHIGGYLMAELNARAAA